MSNDTFGSGAQMDEPGPDVSSLISGPAIALLVAGIINVLSTIGTIAYGLMMVFMGEQMLEQNPALQQNPAFQDLQNQPGGPAPTDAIAMAGGFYLILGAVGLMVGAVIIMGALKMKKCESYGFAMTSSILAMIPCLSSCCLIGLPVGIWCMIVLMKPEVKSAFH